MKTDSKENVLKFLKEIPEAGKTALFYGFLPVESPRISKQDLDAVRDLDTEWNPKEKATILRTFCEMKTTSLPQPLMLFHERPFPGSLDKKKTSRIECELVLLGSQRSVCEALLIQATRAILENAGWKDTVIKINSVGSRENVAEFERRMAAFLKKRLLDFPSDLRQAIKKDPFYLIKSKDEKCKQWAESAPQSVDYLSEDSRLHLKEILEFMETLGLAYEMDPSLIGDLRYSTETVFEIVAMTGEVLARGSRWNRLSRKIDLKKEVAAVGVSISAKALKPEKHLILKMVKPKFYLVQFGPEAKQKSFLVLEKLRKAGISVSHSLAKDKLAGQISGVEQSGVPYIILIGQKEAIDNVVVVRNSSTRAQFVVSIELLGEFIKNSHDFK